MILLFILLLIAAVYCYVFYFTGLTLWFYFLWVPISLILSILTIAISIWIMFLYMKRTDIKGKFRHHLLHQASELIIFLLNIKLEVEGLENIPKETFVCYSNHKSDIDPVLLYWKLHTICSAVGKKSLFKLPVVKQCQPVFGAISLDRDNDREAAKSMIQAIREIKEGMSMIIFPEGGIRSRETEEMVELRAGAYKLVTKTGVPLLPATILGTSKLKYRKHFKRLHAKIIFHAPIYAKDYENLTTQEIGMMVQEIVNDTVRSNAK